jgi:CRP-like cAMP-binding protein
MRYLTKGREIQVNAGDPVYRTGQPIAEDAIYFIVSGSVKLVRTMKDGTEFVYPCGPDDTFGVVSAMAGQEREEDAIALETAQIYVWSKDAFESAVSLYIEFARLAIQNLSRYLRAVNKELAKVGRF